MMHKRILPLLLAALLLRGLLPAGFMPSSAGGIPQLVLCTPQAALKHGEAGKGVHQGQECPYSSMAAAMLPQDFERCAGPRQASALLAASADTSLLPSRANQRPPVRGPPSSS